MAKLSTYSAKWRSNLEALYEKATAGEIKEGAEAYTRYHMTLQGISAKYGIGIVPIVEAFAALSPNNDYKGNLRSLVSCLDYVLCRTTTEPPTVTTYNACRDRALTYLTGKVSFLDTVKGKKITAFRHNLLYPDTSKEVTIDGHMLLAMEGINGSTMTEANTSFKVSYDRRVKVVQQMARHHGHRLPHQMQATLWLVRKRLVDRIGASQYTLFGDNTDLNQSYVPVEEIRGFA